MWDSCHHSIYWMGISHGIYHISFHGINAINISWMGMVYTSLYCLYHLVIPAELGIIMGLLYHITTVDGNAKSEAPVENGGESMLIP